MSERQENKLTSLTNSLLSSQQELATIVAKYDRAVAELAISKETQQRLIGDKDEAIKEKNASNERIKELKQAYDEKIEGQSVEVSKLRDQLQELDRELKISRKQLLDVLDDQRSVSERKEAEISQLKSQLLKANRDLETSKEKIDQLLKKETNAGKSVEALLSKLSNLDDENRAGSSLTDDCKQLQDSLRAAKIEILNLKNEIALTKEESETYKNISQTSETRLMEVSAASEKFQSDTAAVIESLNQRLDLAVRQKTELQLKIDELQAELKIAKEKSDNHDQIVAEIRSKFEKQIEISKEAQIQSQKYCEMLQNDLNTMKSTMTDLQANYEREVQNHSSAVSRVSSLRETINKLEGSHQEIIDERNNAQKQLAEATMKYEQTEQRLSVEIRDLQERIDDLTMQNELLHAQFQQNAIESAQSISHDVQASSNISEDPSKKLSNLMDLINHTQRQKNILQNKLDVSQRERQRLQLQMEQSEKSLADALNLLEKVFFGN